MINLQSPDFSNTPVSQARIKCDHDLENRNDSPIVSIITPFFNTGSVFEETAFSILHQTFQQWEWLIINDGTSDPESLAILETYRLRDPRIKVIDHDKNMGLSAARNTGIRAAQTDYCLFIDSDDLLEPTTAEKWLWFLESHPRFSFVSSHLVCFGALNYLWTGGFDDRESNLDKNRITFVVMIRKSVFQVTGGFDENNRKGLEDWEFWIRAAYFGFWGTSIQEYLFWNRTRQTHTDRWENLQEEKQIEFRNVLREKYSRLWEGQFPRIVSIDDLDFEKVNDRVPCKNTLKRGDAPKILILAPWMVVGGAEKFNLDLIHELSKKGWKISFITTALSDNPWQHLFEASTVDVFALKNFLDWSDYPRFLKYFIESRGIDVVLIAASQEAYRLLPFLRNSFPDLPIIDYLHFYTPDWMEGGYPRLSLQYQNYLDRSITSSNDLKQWMVKQGANQASIDVCFTNIDSNVWVRNPEHRALLRMKYKVNNETMLILFVGRMEKQKQPDIFLKTIALLYQRHLSFIAVMIGDGSMSSWVRDFIRDHELIDCVLFLGSLPNNEVRSWMSAGDILFLPSENEGISLTFFEAMSCGLTVIGADVGGQRELVTPDCGILIPRNSLSNEDQTYASLIESLLLNPERCYQMGISARERIKRFFQVEQMGSCMDTLLRQSSVNKLKVLSTCYPDNLLKELTLQTIAALRARGEVIRVNQELVFLGKEHQRLYEDYVKLEQDFSELKANPPMPPASAKVYFYFAIRQLIYPLYSRLSHHPNSSFTRIKNWFKIILIKENSDFPISSKRGK